MRVKIFFLLVISISFFSCQKEASIENGTGNPTPATTAIKLEKIYWLDTTLSHPKDTLMVQYFLYDANNRINKVTTWQRNFPGVLEENEIVNYFYAGSDTLASRARYMYCFKPPQIVDTVETNFFYNYNSSQRLIKDSFYSIMKSQPAAGNYGVFKYTYSPGGVLADVHGYNPNGIPPDSYKSLSYLQTHTVFGISMETFDQAATTKKTEKQFFYDGKTNPVYKTRPANYPVIQTDNGLQFVPENNEPQPGNVSKAIIKYIDKATGTVTYTETRNYLYEYNAAGLPTVMRVKTDIAGSPVYFNKYIFVYQ